MRSLASELEAAADKHAYPWACIDCRRVFHYKGRKQTSLGPVCADCWQHAKQKLFDESERLFKSNVFVKLLPLGIMSLLIVGPISASAYACIGDANDFRTDVLFGSSPRDTDNMNPEREQQKCEAKGDNYVWENNGCSYYVDCNEHPEFIACNDNDIIAPPITPEPEPVYDCTNGVLAWCVEEGGSEDRDEEEDQIEIEEDSDVEDNEDESESENNP